MTNQHIDFLPKGSIIMWYGNSAEVPNGWAICDGSDNSKFGGPVPDFRGRFAVGANSDDNRETYGKGKTGGAETVQLSVSEMPQHQHRVSGSTNHDGSHEHKWYGYRKVKGDGSLQVRSRKTIDEDKKEGLDTGALRDGSEHSHYINFDSHAAGENKSHENRPPYFAVYYIIKVTDGIQ